MSVSISFIDNNTKPYHFLYDNVRINETDECNKSVSSTSTNDNLNSNKLMDELKNNNNHARLYNLLCDKYLKHIKTIDTTKKYDNYIYENIKKNIIHKNIINSKNIFELK